MTADGGGGGGGEGAHEPRVCRNSRWPSPLASLPFPNSFWGRREGGGGRGVLVAYFSCLRPLDRWQRFCPDERGRGTIGAADDV